MKNKTINSNAFAYLKSLLHPDIKILDCSVRNGWLRAECGHKTNPFQANISMSVRNQDVD